MKVRVDKETDAIYFKLDESAIVSSEEIRPGVILDYDEHNNVVGMELLHASTRAVREQLEHCEFLAV